MTLFGRGHEVVAGCRPGMRWVIQVPAAHGHRALPALSAAGTNRPRGRRRASIPVLLTGNAGPLAAGGTAAASILASLQRFLLAYSGVFALVALTAAVAAGLAATDRLVVSPAGRVTFQAVHRALSLAALGFLASHVLLEVLAHRSARGRRGRPFPGERANAVSRSRHPRLRPGPADRDYRRRAAQVRRALDGRLARRTCHRVSGLAVGDPSWPAQRADRQAIRGLELRSVRGGGCGRPGGPACGPPPDAHAAGLDPAAPPKGRA